MVHLVCTSWADWVHSNYTMINYVIFLFKHEEEDLSSKRKYFLTVNLMFWNWYYTRKNNTLFGGLHQVTDPISNAFSDVSRFRWKTDNVKTRISSLVFKNGNDQSKPKWNVESRLDGKKQVKWYSNRCAPVAVNDKKWKVKTGGEVNLCELTSVNFRNNN